MEEADEKECREEDQKDFRKQRGGEGKKERDRVRIGQKAILKKLQTQIFLSLCQIHPAILISTINCISLLFALF